MGHPSMHSFAHTMTPGWMPITKSLTPHVDEPGNSIDGVGIVFKTLAF